MCIINAKPVKAKEVKAYRVYIEIRGEWVSTLCFFPMQQSGVWVERVKDSFHAWTTLRDAQEFEDFPRPEPTAIYEVRLRGNIKRGKWSYETSMQQYTADECKIIRRVKK